MDKTIVEKKKKKDWMKYVELTKSMLYYSNAFTR